MSTVINCERCEVRCRVAGQRNPDAKMLRRSREAKGLCVNCAVHDFLRNTYPANMLLAESGPKGLLLPHIQKQFAGIMQAGMADAKPDEIDWDRIVENWDLPFPNKIKPSGTNPCSQRELDEITAGKRPGIGRPLPSKRQTVCGEDLTIRSFEELNELKPRLGDKFKRCLRKANESGE